MRNLNSLAITFLPKNRRQTYLLIVLGIVLVFTAGLVWYGFLKEPSSTLVDSQPSPPRVVEIDFKVFETRLFQDLGSRLPPIPLPEEVGKRNPFFPSE